MNMVTWSDIEKWDPANLISASQNLSNTRKSLFEACRASADASKGVQSTGDAVAAMQSAIQGANEGLSKAVGDVAELMMATSEAADGVWDVQTKVLECHNFVAEYPYLTINDDGSVHWVAQIPTNPIDTPSLDFSGFRSTSVTEAAINLLGGGGMIDGLSSAGPVGAAVENMERKQKAQALAKLIEEAINRAVEVDEAYAKRLNAVTDGTYECTESPYDNSQGLPDLPEEDWSPTEVSTWYNSLTESERQELIRNHPDVIGNLDGIPMSARDQANRIRLLGEDGAGGEPGQVIKDAEQEQREALESGDKDRIHHANQKLQDLYRLEEMIEEQTDANGEPLHLLTLDASGEHDVRAAVATGDVDRAENVSTMVPGIGTTVRGGIGGLMHNAETLRSNAGYGDTAVVAWVYDTPPGAGEWDANGSQTDITTTDVADRAAPDLNSFQEGIHAWHQTQGHDPRITTTGHSYGSLTGGTAAMTAKAGMLDGITLYGSPGARADSVHDFNVPEGEVYTSNNTWDFVSGLGLDGDFGPDPHTLDGVRHLNSDHGGHSDYWDNPEFAEDAGQVAAGEDPSIDR
ncbi:MAG: alpha/beta hydrolase [Propionibacteriaceae bacterium]|nr:alpha/beta hydrolase [Propionibacteriaceae bacterium]